MAPRFLQIADLAEALNISTRQALNLVNSGDLPAIRVGGQWRIEATELSTVCGLGDPRLIRYGEWTNTGIPVSAPCARSRNHQPS